MNEIRQVEFAAKDQPLRDDVSILGQLLGEVLVEQHGPELLEQVESVRLAAIRRREDQPEHSEALDEQLTRLPVSRMLLIIRAFSTYLRLVNLAEKVHRIRRRRAYLQDPVVPQRGSLRAAFAELQDAGVSLERLQAALGALRIQPVLTAHPTEATRRSLLEKEYSIILRLVERMNPDLTPREREQALARIRDAVTAGWQTRAMPHKRPTVADELDSILFYLTDILFRVVPPFYEALHEALAASYPPAASPQGVNLLRFGSWVGGDMDGNPNVTATTILETLAAQRRAVIRCYLPEVRRLGRYLSQTRGEAAFSAELDQRLAEYLDRFPAVLEQLPERHRDMPYRCLLQVAAFRLAATADDAEGAYRSPDDWSRDLALVADSLADHRGEHAGLFGVRRLAMRAQAFGFHLATLDIRQDALLHRQVMGELLNDERWMQRPAKERAARLARHLAASETPEAAGDADRSERARETLRVFEAIRAGRQRFGDPSVGLFIVSMTQGPDDVLTVLALARMAGLANGEAVPLDVAPLLETIDDLAAGVEILDALLAEPAYAEHLRHRGGRQVIMVGYSDSNKDGGIAAARWALHEAQSALVEAGRRHGVELVFFHGRGGTVSRGGGNMVDGIAGAPPGSVGGYLRVTEQGEVINQKYGVRPIALRNLELVTSITLLHGLVDVGQHPGPHMPDIMRSLAHAARARFRQLVYEEPDFEAFFRAFTPIDVIERLAIGSRPAARRGGQGIGNLRAIPWVFSWAQVRVGLPGVFGMGSALAQARAEHGIEALRDMYERWNFFHGLVNDVEMVLAKSELGIGRRYVELVEPDLRGLFDQIAAEFGLATDLILELKQSHRLLDDQPMLRRNIRLRNPYVDPLHILQINLLERWRAGARTDDALLDALKSSVNGIALGIQNTG